jgi:hypothetical protein
MSKKVGVLFVALLIMAGCSKDLPLTEQKAKVLKSAETLLFNNGWEDGMVYYSYRVPNHWWGYSYYFPDRLTILDDSLGAREGKRYVKVELHSGDYRTGEDAERAEVTEPVDCTGTVMYVNETTGAQQYKLSVKFDPTWQPFVNYGNGTWAIFVQLHGPDVLGSNPCWCLSASEGVIKMSTRAGDILVNRGIKYDLVNGSLNLGHWIDLIITVKYARDNTGYIVIQRRDEGQTNFTEVLNVQNVPTLQFQGTNGSTDGHYIRHGLYRNEQKFTSIVYLDAFSISKITDTLTVIPVTPAQVKGKKRK